MTYARWTRSCARSASCRRLVAGSLNEIGSVSSAGRCSRTRTARRDVTMITAVGSKHLVPVDLVRHADRSEERPPLREAMMTARRHTQLLRRALHEFGVEGRSEDPVNGRRRRAGR